ncbi:hexokinase-domain-containing protein [Gaertneriomyces semiglobifer]|nr:hexokinase-domain-containing protein [Gaertneriomyces semiglobifer]
MSSFWPPDHRTTLFAFGLTTGIALTSAAQFLYRSAVALSDDEKDAGSPSQGPRHLALSDHSAKAIQRLEKEFTLSTATLHNMVKAFHRDMDRGLKRDNAVLKMVVSYVTKRPTGDEAGTYLALDLGGSNFRVCEVTLGGKGQVRTRQKKFVVADELKTGEGKALFDFFTDCVVQTLEEFGLDIHAGLKLGFTFSFPVEQHAIDKGTLYYWTKGFTASGVVGQDAVQLLQDAFHRKNVNINVCALVNDTVGTLIAHAYADTSTYMGVILGTGCNAAYVEKVDNIPKYKGPRPASGEMIINMEWGAWGQDGTVLQTTPYDIKVDRESPNPGKQSYEKMISGFYLGDITRHVMLELISTGELFGGKHCPKLEEPHSFDTALMSRIERDHSIQLTDTRAILSDLFDIQHSSLADRRLIKRICELVGTRAARLAAVGVASVCTKMNKLNGCTVAVDGSVFEHYPHFANRMRDALRELLGINADGIVLAQARDGSGQGAALIAALATSGA